MSDADKVRAADHDGHGCALSVYREHLWLQKVLGLFGTTTCSIRHAMGRNVACGE